MQYAIIFLRTLLDICILEYNSRTICLACKDILLRTIDIYELKHLPYCLLFHLIAFFILRLLVICFFAAIKKKQRKIILFSAFVAKFLYQ